MNNSLPRLGWTLDNLQPVKFVDVGLHVSPVGRTAPALMQ